MKHRERTREATIFKSQIEDEIKDGAWIEVVCVKTAVAGGNTHRGEWVIYVLNAIGSGEPERSVLTLAGDNKPRIIVTIAGLEKLADSLGLSPFLAPTREGQTVVWIFETSRKPRHSELGCDCIVCTSHRNAIAIRN